MQIVSFTSANSMTRLLNVFIIYSKPKSTLRSYVKIGFSSYVSQNHYDEEQKSDFPPGAGRFIEAGDNGCGPRPTISALGREMTLPAGARV